MKLEKVLSVVLVVVVVAVAVAVVVVVVVGVVLLVGRLESPRVKLAVPAGRWGPSCHSEVRCYGGRDGHASEARADPVDMVGFDALPFGLRPTRSSPGYE